MANCVNHPELPAYRQCNFCGKGMCVNCTFQDEIGQRVIAYATTGDQARAIDYAWYCPSCFVQRAQTQGYTDPSIFPKDKLLMLIFFLPFVLFAFTVWGNVLLAVIIWWPIWYCIYRDKKNKAKKKYDEYVRATHILSLSA